MAVPGEHNRKFIHDFIVESDGDLKEMVTSIFRSKTSTRAFLVLGKKFTTNPCVKINPQASTSREMRVQKDFFFHLLYTLTMDVSRIWMYVYVYKTESGWFPSLTRLPSLLTFFFLLLSQTSIIRSLSFTLYSHYY